MKIKLCKNIDNRGQWIRATIGILLLGYAYWKMSWIVLILALFVLFESLMSWCIIYQILGCKSCRIKQKK